MWLVLVIFHSLCATLDAFYKNPKQHSLALYSVGTKKIGGAVQKRAVGKKKMKQQLLNDAFSGVKLTEVEESDSYSSQSQFIMDQDSWWNLFKPLDDDHEMMQLVNNSQAFMDHNSNKNNAVNKVKGVQTRGWVPDINAWREAIPDALIQKNLNMICPPLLADYLKGHAKLSENHEEKVEELWISLKSMRHLNEADTARVIHALRIAYVGLWGKTTTISKDVSINRARGIAAVLVELKSDVDMVIAGILQEVMDELKFDDNYIRVRQELVNQFGFNAINLAEKYCKMPKFLAKKDDFTVQHAENQIQMLVALSEDYRALYIRLADRVSTLRVLRRLPLEHESRIRIAKEALNVYAPLAHKMGVMKLKGELEDLAFKVISPETFQQTRYTQIAANKAYHEVAEQIKDLIQNDEYLKTQNSIFRISYRIKDKYQLKLKMDRKQLKSLNDVRDALGLRIVIDGPNFGDETDDMYIQRKSKMCYYLVNKLRKLSGWEANGLKDYIVHPKDTGYQSLHQHIHNKALGTNVEVQVRTHSMHMMAETGKAAHWYYKDMIYREDVAKSKNYKNAWRSPQQANAVNAGKLVVSCFLWSGALDRQLWCSSIILYNIIRIA